MRFFFPDSQDTVNPDFDFDSERHSALRVRHRDDQYAHEVFADAPPFDGLLVSKAIVDGVEGAGKYTFPQRFRIRREGVREFFRLDKVGKKLEVIGDCGAFSYVKHKEPPPEFSVDNVLNFYQECQFDYGVSVDHVILAYQPKWDDDGSSDPGFINARERQNLTFDYAADFIREHRARGLSFTPIGVAQGWSPTSYKTAVERLKQMGYEYIALGGMVPLKTKEIIDCLKAINIRKEDGIKLHLLGITRTQHINQFAEYGVYSFDSTSPLMQAFKDEKNNYFAMDRTYSAIRIPQVEGNPGLQKKIKAGLISQDRARILEKRCLLAMKDFDAGRCSIDDTIAALVEYEALYDPKGNHAEIYREVLLERPWEKCDCAVCRQLGYQVILFRGSERNRRRGFHNLWVFHKQLQQELNNGLLV